MKNNKLIKVVSYIDTAAFILFSSALVLLTAIGVLARFVFNQPLSWLEEIQMILVVQVSFFGSSIAFRERGHIAIEIFVDQMPPKVKKGFEVFIWFAVLLALIFLGSQEILRTITQFTKGRVSNILKIPMYLDYLGISIATLLMLINHISVGIGDYFGGKREGDVVG